MSFLLHSHRIQEKDAINLKRADTARDFIAFGILTEKRKLVKSSFMEVVEETVTGFQLKQVVTKSALRERDVLKAKCVLY